MSNKIQKYVPRKGAPFKNEDAESIGQFIYSIENRTTQNILDTIRQHPDHPIHKYYDWDMKKAAEQQWLQQTRNIVNHIEIIIEDPKDNTNISTPAFVSITNINHQKQYVPIESIIVSDDSKQFERKQIISRALQELKGWKERYYIYTELQPLSNHIQTFLNNTL